MLVAGVDFGRHKDPTVSAVLDISREPWRLIRYISIVKRAWSFHIEQVKLILDGVTHTLADATGVGDALYEQLPNTVGVVLVSRIKEPRFVSTNRMITSVSFLIHPLVSTINNRNLVITCEVGDLAKQLQGFQVTLTKRGIARYAASKNLHDDGVFALALAVFAATLQASLRTRSLPHG